MKDEKALKVHIKNPMPQWHPEEQKREKKQYFTHNLQYSW